MHPWMVVGECKSTIVLPALSHFCCEESYLSECGALDTSKVRTVPSGMSVQPSSALRSFLPVELSSVHVRVAGSSSAIRRSNLLPNRKWPFGRTVDGESPIKPHPLGGCCMVQVFFAGS